MLEKKRKEIEGLPGSQGATATIKELFWLVGYNIIEIKNKFI
jgi:hypothetical protein